MRTTARATAAVLVAAFALALASTAAGKTYEVTRTSDPSPGSCQPSDCSLREAVLAANNDTPGPDKIVLPNRKKPYKLTIANTVPEGEDGGTEGDLDVTNDALTILHKGKGRATIDQRQLDRVIEAFSALTLKRIGVTGGDTDESTLVFVDGGGIKALAPLKLIRSTVFRNHGDDGGGLNIDGGVGDTTLTMRDSALVRNRADDDAGAVTFVGAPSTAANSIVASRIVGNRAGSGIPVTQHGGAIDLSTGGSRLTVKKSTFADNHTVVEGGAIYSDNPDQIRIVDSTFSDNQADSVGGGALYLEGSTARVVNSTFSGNRTATSGGAILAIGADVDLNGVTVVRNRANTDSAPASETGGGLANDSSTFTVRNSLLALNRLGPGPKNDCTGTPFTSEGGNLLSSLGPSDVCVGFDGPGDKVRSNPKIGKLAKNGGPTKTVALKKGSPAIGNARKQSAPNRDQRKRRRDDNPDSGAFERGA